MIMIVSEWRARVTYIAEASDAVPFTSVMSIDYEHELGRTFNKGRVHGELLSV